MEIACRKTVGSLASLVNVLRLRCRASVFLLVSSSGRGRELLANERLNGVCWNHRLLLHTIVKVVAKLP